MIPKLRTFRVSLSFDTPAFSCELSGFSLKILKLEAESHNLKARRVVSGSEIRGVVGERSICDEGEGVTHTGAYGSENVGTSNRNAGEIPARRKTKDSFAMVISEGLVGSKEMAKAGSDGHTVNIL